MSSTSHVFNYHQSRHTAPRKVHAVSSMMKMFHGFKMGGACFLPRRRRYCSGAKKPKVGYALEEAVRTEAAGAAAGTATGPASGAAAGASRAAAAAGGGTDVPAEVGGEEEHEEGGARILRSAAATGSEEGPSGGGGGGGAAAEVPSSLAALTRSRRFSRRLFESTYLNLLRDTVTVGKDGDEGADCHDASYGAAVSAASVWRWRDCGSILLHPVYRFVFPYVPSKTSSGSCPTIVERKQICPLAAAPQESYPRRTLR